mgnify:CR=1 FL=1
MLKLIKCEFLKLKRKPLVFISVFLSTLLPLAYAIFLADANTDVDATNNMMSGLFQLSAYAGREEYIHIPSTHFLTQVTVNGVNYHIVWREPTDYQYDMEYQQEYLQMQADIPRMIEGIEFFVPIASEQPEPGAAVYWVVNGAVYHSTDQCPSLSRSKNIQSGTVEEAAAAGKTRACPNCH